MEEANEQNAAKRAGRKVMDLDDARFLEKLRKYDEHAWSTLFDVMYPRLRLAAFKICAANTPDDVVDDLIQDTFMAAFQGIDSFKRKCSLSTWLTAIMRFKWFTYCRNRGWLFLSLTHEMVETIADHHRGRAIDFGTLADILRASLHELIEKEKHGSVRRQTLEFMLELLDQQRGMPRYSEIADLWKCLENTVKARMFDAKEALKPVLERRIQEL